MPNDQLEIKSTKAPLQCESGERKKKLEEKQQINLILKYKQFNAISTEFIKL